jgi:7-cyano-7-deazaguanine tRNA-ribosyltransferase
MVTPNLFPVIHPIKNVISPSDLINLGAQCIFTNAYIIYKNDEIRDRALKEGLHKFLNFDGIIATDSGAFQQYMYNNDKLNINADEIEIFQEKLKPNFAVILDIPVQLIDNYDSAKKKVLMNIERAKKNIKLRSNDSCYWYGPIHGAKYFDLIKFSTNEMNNLDFDVYAIGGLVKTFIDYRFDIALKNLLTVKENLITDKPVHMFGLGLPQFFSLAVACGCDLMDSAAYILYAKENRYFTLSTGTKQLEELEEFPCHCPICCNYTPKELRAFNEDLKTKLLAKHNLYLSFSELRTIRQAIREGNLWELIELRIKSHPNLVNAFKNIKDFEQLFERYEKIYKPHGRLFSSTESLYRPLFFRYLERIMRSYRVPLDAKYLIILPELDTKGLQSPSIREWLEKINNNRIIDRKEIHVIFNSEFFGMIPLELIDTFPMGQNESIREISTNKTTNSYLISNLKKIFEVHFKSYKKFAILIPKNYVNQFGEEVSFNKNDRIYNLISVLKLKFKRKLSISDNLEEILQFFKCNDRDGN